MNKIDHLAELLAKAKPAGWLAPFGAYSPSSVLPIYASGNRQVAESVSREDAALIVAAIHALPALLEIARLADKINHHGGVCMRLLTGRNADCDCGVLELWDASAKLTKELS